MDLEMMEKTVLELQRKVAVLEDLEAIRRLQRSYGYYLEHWLHEEIIDLFSDRPDTRLNLQVGIFLGKEGVRRYYSGLKDMYARNPELLHMIMQLSGVVDIAEDGLTAAGRWYGFGVWALPLDEGVSHGLASGIYTVEYIKEDGVWKIWKFMWNPCVMANPATGWVKPERRIKTGSRPAFPPTAPDQPRDIETNYPSGYIPPFHYPHPVTGKKTSESDHNRDVKKKVNS